MGKVSLLDVRWTGALVAGFCERLCFITDFCFFGTSDSSLAFLWGRDIPFITIITCLANTKIMFILLFKLLECVIIIGNSY